MTFKRFLINSLQSWSELGPGRFARTWLGSLLALLIVSTVGFAESASLGAEAELAVPANRAVALEGNVLNESGEPLVGALVSIFGSKLGSAGMIAFTDEKGRFLIAGLEPGYYTIRAYLSGFLPSRYSRIELGGSGANSAPVSVQMVSFEAREAGAAFESVQEVQQESPTAEAGADEGDDRAAEYEWLLRHAKRNILHEQAAALPQPSKGPEPEQVALFQPTGELGLFAFERGLHDLPTSPGELDAQLAYARVNIPTSPTSEWMVSAQHLESALSSWAARAEYVSQPSPGHQLSAGVSYGSHAYGDGNEFSPVETVGDGLLDRPPNQRTNEWFGKVYGAQGFQIGATSVSAGLAYHHYSYLDRADYAAPRLDVALTVDDSSGTVLRGLFDYRVLAPGGEDLGLLARMVSADFMGSAEWGERGLTAQKTIRYQVSVERFLGDHGGVEFRVFQEDVRDPLLKAYLEGPGDEFGPGHYLVMNQGDLRARGVGVGVHREFGGVAGSVGYRFGVARALAEDVGAYRSSQNQSIHDLTTSVRTEIDPTRTRVLAVYRLSLHPSLLPTAVSAAGATTGADPGRAELDARFNVQVHQLLPFIGWNSTQWELVLAVRNLFYEDLEAASLIDEMSVVDSPARVMGGVKVQF